MKFLSPLRSFFSFSRREMRGVLWLLPLLAVVGILLVVAGRPRFEKSFLERAAEGGTVQIATVEEEFELFEFDPNTVTLQELCRLGFTQRTAAGIIRYRERGRRFEIPEDFATCYGVSLEKYTELEPYIVIGEEFRARPRSVERSVTTRNTAPARSTFRNNAPALADFDPNTLDAGGFEALGFSQAQAAAIVRYRTSIGGFRTPDDFERSYVVSEQMFERLRPHIKISRPELRKIPEPTLIELNTADSARLRTVSGIGEVLVVRVLSYRERLGGFMCAEQLREIQGMTPENFERIRQQIFVDSSAVRKININFAPHAELAEVLGRHPYISAEELRKLLSSRQLKGGWKTIEDMVVENIITQRQAERLAPYLMFKTE
ncbi:MAG: helix-hairpin-helix domain-containing protein [Rikenellaceae bacterium]|nr:helix-hairpin-helix domain-containing protein [Rikenellaceae bacterium]MCL2692779.1 helix-hairpin-helix domain-containing protein [Rikenellaceae bacterium]